MLGDDDVDVGMGVQGIEHVQVAFAGNAEDAVDAVGGQRVDQEAAAGGGVGSVGNRGSRGHGSIRVVFSIVEENARDVSGGLPRWGSRP